MRHKSWEDNVVDTTLLLQCLQMVYHGLYTIKYTFLLMHNGSKCITWLKYQLKLGNIWVIFLNFQNHACSKDYLKDNKLSIPHLAKNMLGYLSLDIICSEKRTLFHEHSSKKTVSFSEDNINRKISEHIFVPNRGYCLYIPQITCIFSVCTQAFSLKA